MDSLLQDLSAEGVEGVDVAVWDGPHVHEEPVFPLARGTLHTWVPTTIVLLSRQGYSLALSYRRALNLHLNLCLRLLRCAYWVPRRGS